MTIKIKTGTRTQVTSAASANTLVPTELIFVTNESKVELATSGNTTVAVGGSSTSNVGDVVYAPSSPDSKWLPCNGQRVNKNVYSDLFTKIANQAAPSNVYPRSFSNKMSDPASLPNYWGRDVDWSPDDRYLAVAHNNSPYVTIYDWSSGSPVKVADPSSLPTNAATGVAWSPDGRYLAVTHYSSPYVTIYDWSSGSPVKIANPATLPTGDSYGKPAWSPNGRYLLVGHINSPNITIYDWSSGAPVKIANPATLPPASAYGAEWSPNGRYLAVAHYGSPYVTIYDWSSGAPVKIANPATLPVGGVGEQSFRVAWSPDGRYLTVSHYASPYITIYDWISGSPVKIANPASLPTDQGQSLSWSPDGRYMSVGQPSSPYVVNYDWTSGLPVRTSNLSPLPTAAILGVSWSSNNRFLACGMQGSPYVLIYDTTIAPSFYNYGNDFFLPKITSTDGTRAFIKALPDSAQTIPFSGRIVPAVTPIYNNIDITTFYAPFYTDVVSSVTVTVTRDVTLHHTFEREGGGLSSGMQRISTVINGVTSNVVTNSNTATDPLRTITAGSTLKYEAYHADYPVNGKMTVRLNDASGQIVETMYFRMGQSYN